MNPEYEVLLYYKYVTIENPEEFMQEHKQLCQKLGLTGRIIIAEEGINGTVEGRAEDTKLYMEVLQRDERFSDISFKQSPGTGSSFPKLSVKVRPEIVSLRLGNEDIDPRQVTGKYLSADELHGWFESGKEFYIVDMRNDYEHEVGHFAGSVLPPLENFRDLPEVLPQLEHLKDKTVVTVCTGGVRCEKASGLLVKSQFKDVYQLKDGIVTYMEKYPNQDFQGQLYVFDNRITMGFNLNDPGREVIGKCLRCGTASEEYVNCANVACHKHFIVCKSCREADGSAYCSAECKQVAA